MLGLLRDLAITLVIVVLNYWFYNVEADISYDFVVNFLTQNQTAFLAIGILGSATLLIFSSMFEGLGIYKITYGVSRVLVRACQLLITFLSILNIVFYQAIEANLMRDNGYLALLALVMLIASACWSLRMIDFNHPTKDTLLPIGILTFFSLILVEFIWPL